jgi:hypothetical protein
MDSCSIGSVCAAYRLDKHKGDSSDACGGHDDSRDPCYTSSISLRVSIMSCYLPCETEADDIIVVQMLIHEHLVDINWQLLQWKGFLCYLGAATRHGSRG